MTLKEEALKYYAQALGAPADPEDEVEPHLGRFLAAAAEEVSSRVESRVELAGWIWDASDRLAEVARRLVLLDRLTGGRAL